MHVCAEYARCSMRDNHVTTKRFVLDSNPSTVLYVRGNMIANIRAAANISSHSSSKRVTTKNRIADRTENIPPC